MKGNYSPINKKMKYMNAKKLFTTLAICVALSLQTALVAATITPSKRYVTAPVKVAAAFTGLCTETAIDIEYKVGSKRVSLYAPDNLVKYIKVTVSKGVLTVGYSENMNIQGNHRTKLVVSAPNVTKFVVNSAGDIDILSDINTSDKVTLITNSAGDISAKNISTKGDVNLTVNSAGDIEVGNINGNNVVLCTSSAGDIEARTVKAQNDARLAANSAGDVEVSEVISGGAITISSNSAGDIKANEVSSDVVNLEAKSAGDVKATNIEATTVNGYLTSTGNISASGFCSKAVLSCMGVGDIDASRLEATDVNVILQSNGDIKCAPIKTLFGRRRSRGKVYYSGAPEVLVTNDFQGDAVKHI